MTRVVLLNKLCRYKEKLISTLNVLKCIFNIEIEI